jgi:hypothetical protein
MGEVPFVMGIQDTGERWISNGKNRTCRGLRVHADVVGLGGRERGELRAKLGEVESGDLFVEFLGKAGHAHGHVLLPELDLGEDLVRERGAHHEGGMARGAPEVHQAAFREQVDRVPVGEGEHVHLRLDGRADDAGPGEEIRHADFVVEVADVADDRLIAHLRHVVGGDDSDVAGAGHEDIGPGEGVLHGGDGVAGHARLECADGVDFGHANAAVVVRGGLRRSLCRRRRSRRRARSCRRA